MGHGAPRRDGGKGAEVVAASSGAVCDGLPLSRYMLAGAVAGMVEHVAMFPVDTIKTRMQVDPKLLQGNAARSGMYRSVFRSVKGILKHEGVRGFYRGVAAMALGAGPAHAVYFATYEKCKQALVSSGVGANSSNSGVHPAAAGLSGSLATVVSDAVALPMDVVKQRLQLPGTPYKGVANCVSRVLREEGVAAFFRSYQTTLVMNIPYTAVHFAVYESAKQMLGGDVEELEDRLLTHVTAGGSAGGIAAAITTPLDVVKTRLQTDCALRSSNQVCKVGKEPCSSRPVPVPTVLATNPPSTITATTAHNPNIIQCMQRIAAVEGPTALLKGLAPRIMFHTPAAAICWTTYEAMKKVLTPQ